MAISEEVIKNGEEIKEIIITDLWAGQYQIGKEIKSFEKLTDEEKEQVRINKVYDEAFCTFDTTRRVRDLLSRPAWANNEITDGKEFFHRSLKSSITDWEEGLDDVTILSPSL